jgi:hypothetical protein
MLKKIKNFICKLLGIKQCACPEDEHIEFYTKVPEPDTPVHVETCPTHIRFRPKCHMCVAHAKGINL